MSFEPKATITFDRYVRQMRYPPLGEAGQRRLAQSRALLCGCGALGTVLANTRVATIALLSGCRQAQEVSQAIQRIGTPTLRPCS